jgi:hypothetical protein
MKVQKIVTVINVLTVNLRSSNWAQGMALTAKGMLFFPLQTLPSIGKSPQ